MSLSLKFAVRFIFKRIRASEREEDMFFFSNSNWKKNGNVDIKVRKSSEKVDVKKKCKCCEVLQFVLEIKSKISRIKSNSFKHNGVLPFLTVS